jgi:hypothetical protein
MMLTASIASCFQRPSRIRRPDWMAYRPENMPVRVHCKRTSCALLSTRSTNQLSEHYEPG